MKKNFGFGFFCEWCHKQGRMQGVCLAVMTNSFVTLQVPSIIADQLLNAGAAGL